MRRHDHAKLLLAIVLLFIFYIFYVHLQGLRVPLAQQAGLIKNGDEARAEAPGGTSEARITIVTMNTKETSYDILSLSNKFSYANRHGYDIKADFEGAGPWHKLNMIESAIKLERFDWIWWIDFDTLITNTTIKVTDIIEEALEKHPNPNSVSMIFTPDCFPLNSGSMIYRASPDVISFLNLVRECGHANPGKSEQDCIRDVVGVNDDPHNHPIVSEEWARRALFVPQWKMNAFPEEVPCWDKDERFWQRGDFVIHFAGAWAYMKDMEDPTGYLMKKYRQEIVDY